MSLSIAYLQLNTATVIKFTHSFFANFDFSLLQNGNTNIKKIDKKTFVTKLRKARLTNHNLKVTD